MPIDYARVCLASSPLASATLPVSVLGFIDALCVLIYGLITETSPGRHLGPAAPTSPASGAIGRVGPAIGAAAAYGRRVGK